MTAKLADHLRALPDDALAALLRLRPDLVVPVPSDISSLAARAQGRVSVARALDALDQFTLEVLDGLRLVRDAGDTAAVEKLFALAAEAGVEPALVRAAIDRLRARFLVYGSESTLHLVRAIDELTTPYPAGLGRTAAELDPDVAELAADPAGLRRTLLLAPPEARSILDRLAEGPPVGSVQAGSLRGRPAADEEPSPVAWLVEHGLLVAIADDLVELPREVGLVLRRDTGPLGVLHPHPPEISSTIRSGVDSAGAGQALEAVRHLDALLHLIADSPAPVLKAFGLGVRDLRRLARDTGTTEPVTALLLEVAYAAGLLTYTDPAGRSGEQQWLPAPSFDTWRVAPLAARWATLARTWLSMTRAPSLIGQRDEKDRAITALSYETTSLRAPSARRSTLGVLAEFPAGSAIAAEAVLDRLAWQAPRRAGRRPGADARPSGALGQARAALVEAAALGITGLDALTSYGRVLLAETPLDPDADPLGRNGEARPGDELVATLDALLPAPVDHVLVQADLTVVVPGPPDPALGAELALIADAESRGGATVYRVTPDSIRRALDTGYVASDIHALFTRRSRTPLPQTLTYLIDDAARRHGGLRVGTAGAYLRSDDEALIAEVLADKRMAGMALRRLAATVLATPYSTARLLEYLRDAGYSPVPEDATGATVLTRPKAARAPGRPAPRPARVDDFDPPSLPRPRLAGIVEQIRLGERLARATRRSPLSRGLLDADGTPVSSTQAHTQALSVLQQALRDQARVWVGYVDAHGGAASRLVRPVSMGSGYLRAEDDRTEMLHTFALHRITSAVIDE
jgi:hypothetical protein